jgi:hypothetical protein
MLLVVLVVLLLLFSHQAKGPFDAQDAYLAAAAAAAMML